LLSHAACCAGDNRFAAALIPNAHTPSITILDLTFDKPDQDFITQVPTHCSPADG
jgi:hypothetical protein